MSNLRATLHSVRCVFAHTKHPLLFLAPIEALGFRFGSRSACVPFDDLLVSRMGRLDSRNDSTFGDRVRIGSLPILRST